MHLEEVEKIAEDFQNREHEDAGGYCQDTGVHVVIGVLLLLFNMKEPLKELVSLVHLIC